MSTEEKHAKLLSHHEQKDLCTTRLPYRQGRKLTAVKVYTINDESKHLLIFGVPSLNLRQETKSLFMKFGKILQFNTTNYPSEQFTETFHAVYESIQSARLAKKMLDTKNYYGGNLHICYAPEMETVEEVREKLLLRKKQVLGRLRNLEKETELSRQMLEEKIEERLRSNKNTDINEEIEQKNIEKMNMGTVNTIVLGKRKITSNKKSIKRQNLTENIYNTATNIVTSKNDSYSQPKQLSKSTEINSEPYIYNTANSSATDAKLSTIDIIDFTSPQTEVISNINEALNYNNFGSEIIKEVPYKPVNRIKFNVNKKS